MVYHSEFQANFWGSAGYRCLRSGQNRQMWAKSQKIPVPLGRSEPASWRLAITLLNTRAGANAHAIRSGPVQGRGSQPRPTRASADSGTAASGGWKTEPFVGDTVVCPHTADTESCQLQRSPRTFTCRLILMMLALARRLSHSTNV